MSSSSSALSNLEPHTRAYLEAAAAAGGPSLADLSVSEARDLMRDGQGKFILPGTVRHQELRVDGIVVHILRPAADGVLPVVLYLHGGGWVLGDWITHYRMVRDLALLTQCAVVFPEYGLAPEATFPRGLEDCYSVFLWIAQRGADFDLDGSRIAVAGDSAGGTLATAVALLAKQREGPQLSLQALLYPVTDAAMDTESYRDCDQGFNLERSAMEWFWNHYAPDIAERSNPLAAPLRASCDQLEGVAPALVITAEFDVLRDEGEAYARKLADAGVPVSAYRSLGTIHSYLFVNALADSPPAKSGMRLLADHLRAALLEDAK